MAGIETVSGACPNCKKAMYQKYESSPSGFTFDACFSCGYATGEINQELVSSLKIWESILGHFDFKTISEFANNTDWLKDCEVGSDPKIKEPIFIPAKDLSNNITDINLIIFKEGQ
jgi:hypothetical protein